MEAGVERVRERIAGACERAGRDPASITLVAVSKGQPTEAIAAAREAGIRHFGENRIQEAVPKIEDATAAGVEATWHLVGHLQSNKAKAAANAFDVIHSVDSARLLRRLEAAAPAPRDVLLQVNVAAEPQKEGVAPDEVEGLVEAAGRTANLRLRGLMTIAPIAGDPGEVRPVFRSLRLLAERFQLPALSMGMTDDFEVAIEEGATLVRVGRAIFGERRS
ncbi:MAG: YggS family pyridoxal phosphate-dependent enzyme [Dehalococcoidia bacterium]|nr:YggS family pyridoxal phosphate-dependent enzyme [Dehalococcoidia bacterium]